MKKDANLSKKMKIAGVKILILQYVLITLIRYGCSETDIFGSCIKSHENPGIKSCFGQQLIQYLNDFESSSNYTLTEGVLLNKDDSIMPRNVPNFLDQDPLDYR